MYDFDIYMKNEYPTTERDKINCLLWIEKFVTRYPKDEITRISMEDFLFSKTGYGNQSSFCNLIFENPLASLGKCQPNMFGFYLKNGTEKMLSSTFSKMFGNDYAAAFVYIKKEISDLIAFGEKNNYKAIENLKLNTAFRTMILTIYFPEKYVPAPTKTALQPYCELVGIPFNPKEDPIYPNIRLVEWKNRTPEIKDWTPWEIMRFCDWLWIPVREKGKSVSNSSREFYTIATSANNPNPSARNDENKSFIKKAYVVPEYDSADDHKYVHEVESSIIETVGTIEYEPKPEKAKEPTEQERISSYPRDPRQAQIALYRANYDCEIGSNHQSFIRKSNEKKYTEPHHIIPISRYKDFEYSVDVPANIISLCSNCHNCIHYGRDIDRNLLLNEIFNKRKEELRQAGLSITLEELLQMY